MSDNPERAVRVMRRQLELLLEISDDIREAIGECSNDELDELDLADEDVTLLRKMGQANRSNLTNVELADAEVLLEMSDQIQLLGESKYSIQRHEFLLRRNLTIAKFVGGLAEALDDREAAEEIVRWINTEQNDSHETNKDYRNAFRMFSELTTDGDGKPDSVEWVPAGYPDTYDPAPQPEKMYQWNEHILPMLEACHNSRDRALIALSWDLGARPSELFDLTVGRVSDHKYGIQVTLYGGKRGTRTTVAATAGPYVLQWLQDHPSSGDPEAPMWTRVKRVDKLSNNRVRDILKEKADAADMTPPSTATPSRMRKSSASYLASEGVPQSHLENHHGWQRGSTVAARYITVFDDVNDREIARAHGVEIEEEDETSSPASIECRFCEREFPRHMDTCMWCRRPQETADVHRLRERTRETRADLLRIAQDDPSLLDDIESTEDLIRLVDERPDTLDEAEALLEELKG